MLDKKDIQLIGDVVTRQGEVILEEMDKKMKELRNDISGEMKELRNDISGEMKELRNDIMLDVRSLLREELEPIKESIERLSKQINEDFMASYQELQELKKRVEFLESQYKKMIKTGCNAVCDSDK